MNTFKIEGPNRRNQNKTNQNFCEIIMMIVEATIKTFKVVDQMDIGVVFFK